MLQLTYFASEFLRENFYVKCTIRDLPTRSKNSSLTFHFYSSNDRNINILGDSQPACDINPADNFLHRQLQIFLREINFFLFFFFFFFLHFSPILKYLEIRLVY